MSTTVLGGLVVAGLAVAVLLLGARWLEHRLLYAPDTQRISPASIGFRDAVREVVLRTPDGEDVIAWYAAAKPGQPTLLYFHGNGAALANRSDVIARYVAKGIGIFMMTYRGYGGSTGTPSEAANVRDAIQAYAHLRGLGVPANDIVLYGESLGSGVAVQVAVSDDVANDVAGIVLDAPYTAIVDVATLHYPYLPARFFMKDRYETMSHIGKVTAPVLVVHGEADRVIPASMGRTVSEATGGPAEYKTFPGAGHNDHDQIGSFEAILDWLQRVHGARQRSHHDSGLSAAG